MPCATCLYSSTDYRPVPPLLNPSPKMLVVLEAPGYGLAKSHQWFRDPASAFIVRMLEAAQVDVGQCSFFHVVNCPMVHMAGDKKAWEQSVKACRENLSRYLDSWQGTVLAMGAGAQQALTGLPNLKAWCGAPTASPLYKGITAFSTFAPFFVRSAAGRPYWPIAIQHINRAWRCANGKLPAWKWPELVLTVCDRAEELLTRVIESGEEVGLDVETNSMDAMNTKLTAVGIGAKDFAVCLPYETYNSTMGPVAALNETPQGRRCKELLDRIITGKNPKVLQNGIYDALVLHQRGLKIGNYQTDLLPAYLTAMPGVARDLGFIAAIEFHAERWKSFFKSNFNGNCLSMRTYCAKDAWMTRALREPALRRVESVPGGPALYKSRMACLLLAVRMTKKGMRINKKYLRAYVAKLEQQREYYRQAFYKVTSHLGYPERVKKKGVLISSNKDLGMLLHDVLHQDLEQTEKGAWAVDASILSWLKLSPNPFVKAVAECVLGYRKQDKLIGLLTQFAPGPDGRIHPQWNPAGARTGRWCGTNPPIQTLPGKLRSIIIPFRNNHFIVECDYNGLEGAISAHVYHDMAFLEVFAHDPTKVHNLNAMLIWPEIETPESCPKDKRQLAKMGLYASLYGASANTMYENMRKSIAGITLKEIDALRTALHRIRAPIFQGSEKLLHLCRKHDCRVEGFGEYRPPLYGAAKDCYDKVRNQIVNARIQSFGARLTNNAFLRLWPLLNQDEHIIAQIHDALVCTGPDPVRLATLLKQTMEQEVTLGGVKLTYTVSIKVGRTWGDKTEYTTLEDLSADVSRGIGVFAPLPRPPSSNS